MKKFYEIINFVSKAYTNGLKDGDTETFISSNEKISFSMRFNRGGFVVETDSVHFYANTRDLDLSSFISSLNENFIRVFNISIDANVPHGLMLSNHFLSTSNKEVVCFLRDENYYRFVLLSESEDSDYYDVISKIEVKKIDFKIFSSRFVDKVTFYDNNKAYSITLTLANPEEHITFITEALALEELIGIHKTFR